MQLYETSFRGLLAQNNNYAHTKAQRRPFFKKAQNTTQNFETPVVRSVIFFFQITTL